MFSRPLRSDWKPAPSSRSPASLPRTATSPDVGWRTPQMHLSSVDLPEPLRPRMPTVSPSRTERDTSRKAQKSSVTWRRPPWMRRSLRELYWPWASRKRLETPRTSTARSLTSQLLGEVALEPAEGGERDEEEDGRQEEHAEVEPHVPEHPVGRQDRGLHSVDGHHGFGVDAPLEAEDQLHHGVEEVDPRQPLGAQPRLDLGLERVDDRTGPEPGGQDNLNEVLGVPQVHVHRGQEHGDGGGEDDTGDQSQEQHREVREVGHRVQDDEEDPQHDGLEQEEAAGRADRGQRQDLPGERDLLHDAAVGDHGAGAREHAELKEVPQQQAGEEEYDEVRDAVLEDDGEHDPVDRERHGRGQHRPEDAQHRVLVLDLDFRADEVGDQLAREPQLTQPLAHPNGGGDDARGGAAAGRAGLDP